MNQPKGQSTAGKYSPPPLSVVGSEKAWFPQEKIAITEGGGGNDGLGERVAKLEAHVEHIHKDIGEIKQSLKDLVAKIDRELRERRIVVRWAVSLLIGAGISIGIYYFSSNN